MSQNNVPVEYLITRYFVRYQQLDSMIPVVFKGSKANVVNIYIDLMWESNPPRQISSLLYFQYTM